MTSLDPDEWYKMIPSIILGGKIIIRIIKYGNEQILGRCVVQYRCVVRIYYMIAHE